MNKLSLTAFCVAAVMASQAQTGNVIPVATYQRAESMLGYGTEPFVDHAGVQPSWMAGDRFWYRTLTPQGSVFMLVDPVKGSRVPAFDQAKLAAALSTATGKQYEAEKLPFQSFRFSPDNKSIHFMAEGQAWQCD